LLLAAKAFSYIDSDELVKKHKGMVALYEWMESIVLGIAVVFAVFTFLLHGFSVDGHSMNPTLQDTDRLILWLAYFNPGQGDIVVITQPNKTDPADERPLVKRVVAVAGQTVDIDFDQGIVYVDGIALEEPYVADSIHQQGRNPVGFPLYVEEGTVFVLGDNRNDSRDSRDASVGLVDIRYIKGRVIARFWPVSDMEILIGK